MTNLLIVFGTRPEAIKLCPLVLELHKYSEKYRAVVCVTGQHREMLDPFLKTFGVTPAHDLNLMKTNQTLSEITAGILLRLSNIIQQEQPDMVLVQGDTTTTFAASLAAYYHKVKVGHIEAGLRTYRQYSPFPEELNRRLTSAIADIHFAPTLKAKQNLLAEGIPEELVHVTGNTVIDALIWVKNKIIETQQKYSELKQIDFSKRIILVTGHRRETFGQRFIDICDALKTIAVNNPEVEMVYPVHLNPNVREPVYSILGGVENIKLIEPLDYEPFVYLMDKSYFIVSDSGGIQEEAPSLGKPVLITRETTERPEGILAGAVKLVGTNKWNIIHEAEALLSNSQAYDTMSRCENPYGDGHACKRILDGLIRFFDRTFS